MGFVFVGCWVYLSMHNNMGLMFKKEKKGDIPNIVKLLADDDSGLWREDYKIP